MLDSTKNFLSLGIAIIALGAAFVGLALHFFVQPSFFC
jgi:hypothetical protein